MRQYTAAPIVYQADRALPVCLTCRDRRWASLRAPKRGVVRATCARIAQRQDVAPSALHAHALTPMTSRPIPWIESRPFLVVGFRRRQRLVSPSVAAEGSFGARGQTGGRTRKAQLPVAARSDHEVVGPPSVSVLRDRVYGVACHPANFPICQLAKRSETASGTPRHQQNVQFVHSLHESFTTRYDSRYFHGSDRG
jgi:hypothetical protein